MNNTINRLFLNDIYTIVYKGPAEQTYFANTHNTVLNIDHMLVYYVTSIKGF